MDAALGRAVGLLPEDVALAEARAALAEQRRRFSEPIRVALVGRVSAGKSTLANALLGGRYAATGATELTYNVNWFRNAPGAGLTIHHLGGPVERVDPPTVAALVALTARRREADQGFLAGIDYLEFAHPNPNLAMFDLIDTPGLDSVFATDSATTLRVLGLSEDGVRATSLRHAAEANALVHVLSSRGQAAREEELLGDFHRAGPALTSPVTAIGALTKVERFWSPDREDVLAVGRRVAGRLMREGRADRSLYELHPLASLVGAAAATLGPEDFDDLGALAHRLSRETLVRRVKFGPGFAGGGHQDLPVPPERRRSLFQRLNAYGIVLACDLIRDDVPDLDALRRELYHSSGLSAFRTLLVDHFGRRADLIKLDRLIAEINAQVAAAKRGARAPGTDWVRSVLDRAAVEVTRMAFQERAFDELTVVHDYYADALTFSDQDALEALRIVGERGTSAAERLGLPVTASRAELAAHAHASHQRWAALANDPGYGGATRRACRVVQRSVDALIEELDR
ncbi:dynamin family protein [Streptacidiphilus sp. EB129]|uniref:dynamin family protein n=1 Tax=Streptacidiphilus sp. EB129 TaxID=3156262 RepID=UPI0035192CD5